MARRATGRQAFEAALVRSMPRRRLLAATGTLAALGVTASLPGRPTRVLGQGTGGATPVTDPELGGDPFTLGVASGDPLPGAVVLWTRLAPAPLEDGGGMPPVSVAVRWEVASDDRFATVVASGEAVAAPELAHSVHVDADGLDPATPYWYRFMVGDAVSPAGRTMTAPAAGAAVDRVLLAMASCSNYEHGYFGAYRGIAADAPDLVVHLGDYIYEYGAGRDYADDSFTPVRAHDGPETRTLAQYRARHAQYHADPDLQAAHAAAPWVVTWDDHEVENNYAADVSADGEPVDTFLERRAAAYQAYYEHMPLRPSSMPAGPDLRLYRSLGWGDLLDVVMLDGRQYRTDQPCGDDAQTRCAASLDPDATMLGPDQERWLLSTLDASEARWRAIGQQTMLAQLRIGTTDPLFNMDQWDGYPAARARILQHLASRGIPDTVVLTGDIHSAWVNDLKLDFDDEASDTVATEFVCSSVTAYNPLTGQLPLARLFNPHVRWVDGLHGYTLNTLTPESWTAEYRTVADVADVDASVTTATTWVVEAGRPGATGA